MSASAADPKPPVRAPLRSARRPPAWMRLRKDGNIGDTVFRRTTALFAMGAALTAVFIAAQMARAAWPAMGHFGWGFIVGSDWDPVRDHYGALPFIWGTVASSLLALCIAVPIGLGVAVVLTDIASPRAARILGFLVEMLAAVPSVVYGLWGVFLLAPLLREWVQPALARLPLPFFAGPQLGVGMLAGGVILAIMILPTIASVSREVLRAVPPNLREGALALGATRWETLRAVVLPYARSGIVGAVILGLGRALGETMAVTMVIGNKPTVSASLFSPAYTMASVIANEFTEATGDLYLSALMEVGLLLFGVTLLLNIIARLLVWRVGRLPAGGR